MECKVKRDVLLEGIQRTLGIVERKTTMPILGNILLKTSGDSIRVVATDRDLWLIADYEAKVKTGGEITVNARKLYEMVREIEGGTIHIKQTGNEQIFVTCDKVVFRIAGIPASEFPQVVEEEGKTGISVQCDTLSQMIGRTFFAVSQDEMRPSLNGVLFEIEKGVARMVATDGHRLALSTVAIEGEKNVKGIIIPRKGLSELRKIIEDGTETAVISVKDGICVVKVKNVSLKINLIDAEFPDYRKVLPKDRGADIRIETTRLAHALRRMSVMSSERFSGVKIDVSGGKMVLTSTNPDLGEARDEIDVKYEGKPIDVGYSVRYLMDAIDVITENEVSFEIRGTEGPGIIRSVEDDRYICIIMPIKLREE